MAACRPSSGSKSGALARSGATTSATATATNARRRLCMWATIVPLPLLEGRDERVVIRVVLALGAPQRRAPSVRKAEDHVVQPQRTERRAPIFALRVCHPRRHLAVRGTTKSNPRVETAGDDERAVLGQRALERARLPQPSRFRE